MSLPLGTPEEFNKKFPMSIGLMLFILVCAVLVTISVINSINTDKELTKEVKNLKEIITMEVGGLRSDMEKEDAHIKKALEVEIENRKIADDELNGRMNRKIENHKKEKNPH